MWYLFWISMALIAIFILFYFIIPPRSPFLSGPCKNSESTQLAIKLYRHCISRHSFRRVYLPLCNTNKWFAFLWLRWHLCFSSPMISMAKMYNKKDKGKGCYGSPDTSDLSRIVIRYMVSSYLFFILCLFVTSHSSQSTPCIAQTLLKMLHCSSSPQLFTVCTNEKGEIGNIYSRFCNFLSSLFEFRFV